ncbi:similar to Saccharomyces cerevisiae YMR033W ARP9 Component of both the SWI/SNF and RSC chromatin remodeling complexes [Maudiozyma barnettii]|uniref:Similar to Saccharomyces cerevisiae YMR033W ARP9 Component of both the SWI/SNF and RSC chromatin remodeling complexes n=1 Tax=Maudiozyma barnettii TaxID=61262 RepID=A0A8H2VJD0_9SACH|nr:Arp9p [Kazachstania barnettii]CAB4256435.1 similar to Saccharomyces cerevisiae YMR033W ARP9 Component of both the SWI/SNF and RSC chromatin remodeling complexes [Kazachstania barnettii]CAD1785044.1 similar to Saccharomyces cerevisiae YMR033W ARP9 Component of both the SWI/SNF and RSC chromatin remodeling complexes [Kazachstania barnettii]
MAPFRPDSILIIDPKSDHVLVQFGVNDETFMIPDYKIPSCIYKDSTTGNYLSSKDDGNSNIETIYPIVNGEIKDIEAFLQLLKTIYGSVLAEKSKNNPNAFDIELANIPLLLITQHSWSQFQLEKITHFIFEELKINYMMLLPTAVATAYAMVSLQNCCVIDIGGNHTDIIPIVDYTAMNHLTSSLSIGGNSITETLKDKYLPQLSLDQIESLKKSNIFEVLTDNAVRKRYQDDLENSITNGDGNDEDIINVADLVTSGRDAREVLEERERSKKEKNVSNAELEYNYYWDTNGNNIKVGKERFQGCEQLINSISRRVGITLSQISDTSKLKAVWENIVIIGGTSSIQGFKEELLNRLIENHLITEPETEMEEREDAHRDPTETGNNKKKATKAFQNMITSAIQNIDYVQAPSVIRLAKYAEYFPEWKKYGYAEIQFLGGQVVAKQVFTHSRDVYYVTRENYDKFGPTCIWDVEF